MILDLANQGVSSQIVDLLLVGAARFVGWVGDLHQRRETLPGGGSRLWLERIDHHAPIAVMP